MAELAQGSARTPTEAIHALDRAFVDGNIEGIVSLYEEEAFVVAAPGLQARGTAAIRALYTEFAAQGATVHQNVERVLEADGIALYLSQWTLTHKDGTSERHVSTVVLRKQADGGWKVIVDNARGPKLLDAEEA